MDTSSIMNKLASLELSDWIINKNATHQLLLNLRGTIKWVNYWIELLETWNDPLLWAFDVTGRVSVDCTGVIMLQYMHVHHTRLHNHKWFKWFQKGENWSHDVELLLISCMAIVHLLADPIILSLIRSLTMLIAHTCSMYNPLPKLVTLGKSQE